MALSFIRLCGRMLFVILLWIQNVHLFSAYITVLRKQYAWIAYIYGFAFGLIVTYYTIKFSMLGDWQRRHLSTFFHGWQFYIRIVLVPSIIGAFGLHASLAGKRPWSCLPLPDNINVPLCTTPILLIVLLTTADDAFSSESHKELVRNLSVFMVADLFDAIEMLDNAFETIWKAYDVSVIFLVIGAIITVIVSSLQLAEYEFIEGLEDGSKEQIRYKPNVFRKIAELVINVVVLTIRLKVLFEHGKTRPTVIIFKNFIAIILSVIHVCSLTPSLRGRRKGTPVSRLQSRAWSFACLGRFARRTKKEERLLVV